MASPTVSPGWAANGSAHAVVPLHTPVFANKTSGSCFAYVLHFEAHV
jgi:hypothetical protein